MWHSVENAWQKKLGVLLVEGLHELCVTTGFRNGWRNDKKTSENGHGGEDRVVGVLWVREKEKKNSAGQVAEDCEKRRRRVDGVLSEGGRCEENAVFDDGEGERNVG